MLDDLTSVVESIIDRLGMTFLFAGFLPMLIAVAINQYLLFPPDVTGGTGLDFFPALTAAPLLHVISGQLVTTILLAAAFALLIMPLNLFIVRLFEGLLPGMKILLYPLLALKRRRHNRFYAPIEVERAGRRELLADYEETGEYNEEADFAVQDKLHHLHTVKEKSEQLQMLPYDAQRLLPTRYGNAWAVIEEYPYARYGMDGMFYWPYLRTIILTRNPGLLQQIDSQKLLVDVTTYMSLVAGILTIEGVILGVVRGGALALTPLIVAGAALAAFLVLYEASISYIRTMGLLITQSYDLYRLHVLEAFGLALPEDLDSEYWVWMRLKAFLRRGEPFYFDLLDREGGELQSDDNNNT